MGSPNLSLQLKTTSNFIKVLSPQQIGMFKLSLLLLVFAIQLNVGYGEEDLQVDAEDALNDLQVDAEDAEDRRIRPPQIFGPCMEERCQQTAECKERNRTGKWIKGKCCVYVPFNRKVVNNIGGPGRPGTPLRCRPKSKLPNLLTHCRCTVPK